MTDIVTTWVEGLLNSYQEKIDQGLDQETAREAVLATVNQPNGSFQDSADTLSELTKRSYSRQAVHQLWRRRNYNGFPDKKKFFKVTVTPEMKFDLKEVQDWHARFAKNIRGTSSESYGNSGERQKESHS